MSKTIEKIINILDVYEGRDAAITLTLYFCCLLSGFYPIQSTFHQSFQRIFKRLEDCRVVLRLYDDLTILKDFFTYELRPGERNRIVRLLKCLHYFAWLFYYPSEHISWLGEMNLIEIDEDFWQFYTNFFWSVALGTSALWNLHVFLQFMSEEKRKKSNDKTSSKKKKPLIPWINARNALLAMIRDGSEFIVAIHYLPEGYLWSSKLTYIQVGVFGTCSASLRLFTLFTFRNTA